MMQIVVVFFMAALVRTAYSSPVNIQDEVLVIPVSIEGEEGTDITIGCSVTSLSQAVTGVKWTHEETNFDLDGVTNYNVVTENYDGSSSSQLLTLVVAGAATTADSYYYCEVTEDDGEVSKTKVYLNVFHLHTHHTYVATARNADIYCIVDGVTTTASVTWLDDEGNDVVEISPSRYSSMPGIAYNNGQTSVLTITPLMLMSLSENTTFTCVVRSGEFHEDSPDVRITLEMTKMVYVVTPFSKEVETGSEVAVSCEITGITEPVDVVWSDSFISVRDISQYTAHYSVDKGCFNARTRSQISILTLKYYEVMNQRDQSFYCSVTSEQWMKTDDMHSVRLNVFEVDADDEYITNDRDVVLTCHITGITTTTSVTWWNEAHEDLQGVAGYTILTDAAVNNTQHSNLTIARTLVEGLSNATSFSCVAKSGEFPAHSPEVANSQTLMKVRRVYSLKTLLFAAAISVVFILFLLLICLVIFVVGRNSRKH